ncbi:hypothetical protein CLAFUW4_00179 [Fulvia fulva]|uniref:Uncharacterized protein n=1 Tax=Passalora fulva TaxID=5499 RepID=A0A9Q8L7V6_PASFU|nr:uncharacterized protein CLAFUR5_00178 [Fulvia fulva]KAK4634700.1 hypothetical protein CLAFUR4_00179 [Fulvia fulva]KAK4637607.1 hypothetical protein CLAFUR0_00178 [Fulvia fulva]UJO12417.1 hypothetical protein CLAFUR5_00178 [Fulvia fulva]WPV10210.1 hypothetical protein CLAFUW4_00179 [Fulvia fulva]WPV23072.1 hypothetical protein CLAFUW7_00180 [Fulvia fulva]
MKFPLMGFDATNRKAIIYDEGTEPFTGTTLEGIGQAVIGVLKHPDETANRFVKVLSIKTSQNQLLNAFEKTGGWEISRSTTRELKASGMEKFPQRSSGWTLELAVAQLYESGEARCVVTPWWLESESKLLGVKEECEEGIVKMIIGT